MGKLEVHRARFFILVQSISGVNGFPYGHLRTIINFHQGRYRATFASQRIGLETGKSPRLWYDFMW